MAAYKIIPDENGKVRFLMRSGKDLVESSIPLNTAQQIAEEGKVTMSSFQDLPIAVDDKFFFPGEIAVTTKPKKAKA